MDSHTIWSTAWCFNVSTSGLTLNSTPVEILNTTKQMILLGEKFRQWDNEASSMRMIIPDISHVKTVYPRGAWPSAYAVVKWDFGFDGKEGKGRWVCCAGGGV